MKGWVGWMALVLMLAGGHVFALQRSTAAAKTFPGLEQRAVILPSPILKIMALEFAGVVADFLFLEASAFHGEILERNQQPAAQSDEWRWLGAALRASADLDPYFYDPYYFANATLPWQGLVEAANGILEVGVRARDWDWTLPFYLGFNHFFFLQDQTTASEFLMESGRRPGAPSFISTWAARLAYQENRTENAIMFLQQVIEKTQDSQARATYQVRLTALIEIRYLEQAVADFSHRMGTDPGNLEELVTAGIIDKIPLDPYGGTFYLDDSGAIKTTSELR